MWRDPRLRPLSSEHHDALVLARRIAKACAEGRENELTPEIRRIFDSDLAPHFALEEEVLLPALRAIDQVNYADRVESDHRAMEKWLSAAETGRRGALASFGTLLAEHVRYEERVLFTACQALLPSDVLDQVFARHNASRTR